MKTTFREENGKYIATLEGRRSDSKRPITTE